MFLWPGFPYSGGMITAAPSVNGMRWLPVTLIAFLLFFQRPRWAGAALVPAVLWSPETALAAIAVFGVCETARIGLSRATGKTALTTGISFLGLFAVHRIWYGVWIEPRVMVEYILHVPGPIPIDPLTDFVFLAAALSLAAWIVCERSPDQLEFQRDLIVAALLFATTSYFLGRSHPNNVCNLMPFIALVAVRALQRPLAARLTIVGLSAATAAISLAAWTNSPFDYRLRGYPGRISADPPELALVRSRIVNPKHEGIAVFGPSRSRDPDETVVWTPMDPPLLWTYVPSERRKLYIARAAARLKLPGWIITNDEQRPLLEDFRVAYRITEETRDGQYTVVHLEPIVK
jgi:hypothetical protein